MFLDAFAQRPSGFPRYNTCDSPHTLNNKQFQPVVKEEVCLWALQAAGEVSCEV